MQLAAKMVGIKQPREGVSKSFGPIGQMNSAVLVRRLDQACGQSFALPGCCIQCPLWNAHCTGRPLWLVWDLHHKLLLPQITVAWGACGHCILCTDSIATATGVK